MSKFRNRSVGVNSFFAWLAHVMHCVLQLINVRRLVRRNGRAAGLDWDLRNVTASAAVTPLSPTIPGVSHTVRLHTQSIFWSFCRYLVPLSPLSHIVTSYWPPNNYVTFDQPFPLRPHRPRLKHYGAAEMCKMLLFCFYFSLSFGHYACVLQLNCTLIRSNFIQAGYLITQVEFHKH